MGDTQPNPDPNDRPAPGPEYTMFHDHGAGRDLQLLTELRQILLEFRFWTPQRDIMLNAFVDDIVYFMSNTIPRRTFRFHMLYIRNMIITANTENEQHNLTQPVYNRIISIIDELLHVLNHEPPQGTNNAGLQGSGGAASALQWTALERLMNLMDKHADIKI